MANKKTVFKIDEYVLEVAKLELTLLLKKNKKVTQQDIDEIAEKYAPYLMEKLSEDEE